MVLSRTGALAVFVILLGMGACSQASKTPPIASPKQESVAEAISARIASQTLALRDKSGHCTSTIGDRTLDLDIAAPCDFHRKPNGEVRVFPDDFYAAKNKPTPKEYLDVKIVLVLASKRLAEHPEECRTELQGIKLAADKNPAKSVKMGNLASCSSFQWDEKTFTALFE